MSNTTNTTDNTEDKSKIKEYDDELDEKFEKDFKNKTDINKMEQTSKSFEEPKGIEDSQKLELPKFDKAEVMKALNELKNMDPEQRRKLLESLSTRNNMNIPNTDFNSVNNAHRMDTKEKLKMIIKNKRMARMPNSVKQRAVEKQNNQTQSQHQHNANCAHGCSGSSENKKGKK